MVNVISSIDTTKDVNKYTPVSLDEQIKNVVVR